MRDEKAGGSIVFGQEYRGGRPVSFGDDPELHFVAVVIDREEPKVLMDGDLILMAIVIVNITPITGGMSNERVLHILWMKDVLGARRDHDLPQWKLRRRHVSLLPRLDRIAIH